MKDFFTKLTVGPEYSESKVIVQTNDSKFGQSMLNHINQYSVSDENLRFKTETGFEVIAQDSIIYLEIFQRKITIYHTDGELSVKLPLTKIQEYLDKGKFQQISKSVIINVQFLRKIEAAFSGNYYGYLVNRKVVISRRYIKQLKNRLNLIGGK